MDNFEQKIGFDRIRNIVAERCLSAPARELIENMSFTTDFEIMKNRLCLVDEFTKILRLNDDFPTDGYCDNRDALRKIRIEGAYLTERELFDLSRSLAAIDAVVSYIKSKNRPDENNATLPYPCLQALAADVATFPHITKQIGLILDRFGQIRDNASPTLADIRRKITSTVNSISRILNTILRKAQSEGLVEKDSAPAMRDGRLVIPVPPAYKRRLQGIVHDESATGKTVFIEPQEVVEANNRVRELENDEKHEIIKILTEISDKIRPELSEIDNSNIFLSEIDTIRAKALFAIDIDARLPELSKNQIIDWQRAIHPLLLISHRKAGKTVSPLDIELGNPDRKNSPRIVLVSGPNAGGKSVLLKTVGLLQYMLQNGLLIPVGDHSTAGIFDKIFIDIGDEQSIENDLSTYSSHLTNMKFMLRNADNRTLILIDEFGGGTEPRIGGAIAEALLDRFVGKGCFGVITTHYHNLKTYAEDHPGIVNGAMLYDRNGMRPLFQLSIGKPGSSFAIEIARNIGLPEDLIAEASDKAGHDYINLDKYLQDIVRDKRYWEQKRQDIRHQEKQLEEAKLRYETETEKLKSERRATLASAKQEAENMLKEANSLIEKTIRDIKEAQAEKEKTREIRKKIDDFKNTISGVLHTKPVHQTDKPATKTKPASQTKTQIKLPAPQKSKFNIGDQVKLKGQQTVGTIIDSKDDFFIVAFGAVKTNVKESQIESAKRADVRKDKLASPLVKPRNNIIDIMEQRKMKFKPEIDIRGLRADEALQAVMYYIDDAVQCAAGRVRILHGTGTGALRQVVRDYLRSAPGVHKFADENVQFGGAGITVVELE